MKKKFYYAKLVGYVMLVSEDKALVDDYLSTNEDMPLHGKGVVEAESVYDAYPLVRKLLGVENY